MKQQRSPSAISRGSKGSRHASANHNNSIAISVIDKSRVQPESKQERMKSYAQEQRNISKQHDPIDIQQLVESNTKLRAEIQILVVHLDNTIKNVKERKKPQAKQPQPDEPKDKLHKLNTQTTKILENAQLIKQLQKMLENTFDDNKIKQIEDNKRSKMNELEQLVQEFQAQSKIVRRQKEGIEDNDVKDYKEQLKAVKSEYAQEQKYHRDFIDESNKLEKEIQLLHNVKVSKLKSIQHLEAKIKQKNPNEEDITEDNIKLLEKEIQQLIEQRDRIQIAYADKLKQLESQKTETRIELGKKSKMLMQLERESKINRVFIHEAERVLRQDERNGMKSKIALSAPKQPTTPSNREIRTPKQFDNDTTSVRSKQRQDSKKEIIINEEQFEETMGDQVAPVSSNKEVEEQIDEQSDNGKPNNDNNNEESQQPNVYKKPMFLMKLKK